jgi:hypothetical protein
VSMSSQGPGWWQASDGRWYPPDLHPSATPAPVPTPPPFTPPVAAPQPTGPNGWEVPPDGHPGQGAQGTPPTPVPASQVPSWGPPSAPAGPPPVPPAYGQPAYGQPVPPPGFSSPAPPRPGPRRGLLIGLAVVVAVLLVGAVMWLFVAVSGDDADVGSDGSVPGAGTEDFQGDTDVYDLVVGDCFDDPTLFSDELVEVDSVDSVPCSEGHDAEVYAVTDLPQGSDEPFPGDDEVDSLADKVCWKAFGSYVGTAYDDSELYYSYYLPLETSWAQGDRMVTCMLTDYDGASLEGSMKDSGR